MKITLFIPIKLNNQRFPGKNLINLNGKPLCQYLFKTVNSLSNIDNKYVYCSDESIIKYLTGDLKFLRRDKKLDGFEIKGLDIIEAFVNQVDSDIYVLTHVTQPFVKTETFVKALNKVIYEEYDSAFSAVTIQDYAWYKGKPINYNLTDIVRTQDLEPIYIETGAFFIFKKEVFVKLHRRIGLKPYICPVDQFEAIDIDTKEDFDFAKIAERYLHHE